MIILISILAVAVFVTGFIMLYNGFEWFYMGDIYGYSAKKRFLGFAMAILGFLLMPGAFLGGIFLSMWLKQ